MSGEVITFYSYKGGSGRTLGLANVAAFLARKQKDEGKILVIDWDLDSPGLHRYFQPYISNAEPSDGLIELFELLSARVEESFPTDRTIGKEVDSIFDDFSLDSFITPVQLSFSGQEQYSIDFIKAGKLDQDYVGKARRFNWEKLWDRAPNIFSAFATYLSEKYHWILIDSRSGFTLTSTICSMLMPSKLIVVFTPNSQSLEGIKELTSRAAWARKNSDDYRPLVVFPLPSRVEAAEETRRQLWRFGSVEANIEGFQPQFEQFLGNMYELDELDCNLDSYFNEVQIQHTSRYAYGEEIAALVERPDRFSLARSFETFVNIFLEYPNPWSVSRTTDNITPEIAAIEAHCGLSSSLRKADDWLGALVAIFKAAKKLRQPNINVPTSVRNRTIDRLSSLLKEISEKNRLEGHGDDVLALDVVSSHGQILIASASKDQTVKLWRANGFDERSFYLNSNTPQGKVEIRDVAISPDATLVAAINNKGELRLLTRKIGETVFSIQAHVLDNNPKLSMTVCFISDGESLLTSSSEDSSLKIWNLRGKLQDEIPHHFGVSGIDFNAARQLIATVSRDKYLRILNLAGQIYEFFIDDGNKVELLNVVFDPTGNRVAVSCSDSTVRIWNLEGDSENQPLKLIKTSKERVFNVFSSAFSPCNNYLVTACDDGHVRIWDLSTNTFQKLKGHNDEVRAVKFLAEDLIVSGGGDNSLRIWKFRKNENESQGENDLDLLLTEACQWLQDYLRTNRNLETSDRYLCTDI